MTASTTRHETRALLRAHLAAASGYRHLTGRCPICHRLQRLAMEPGPAAEAAAPGSAPAGYGSRDGESQITPAPGATYE